MNKQYTDDILQNSTPETNFINQCHPNKLNKKGKRIINGNDSCRYRSQEEGGDLRPKGQN